MSPPDGATACDGKARRARRQGGCRPAWLPGIPRAASSARTAGLRPRDVGAARSPSSQTAENVHRHAGSTESEAPDVPASIRTPFVSFLRMRAVRTTCAPVSPELLRAFCGGRKTWQVLGFVHSGTSGVPVRARCMPHHALFDLRCVIDGQHMRSSGSHPLPHWRSNGSPSGCGPAKRRFPARRRADGGRVDCRLLLLLTYKDRLAHKTRITANWTTARAELARDRGTTMLCFSSLRASSFELRAEHNG